MKQLTLFSLILLFTQCYAPKWGLDGASKNQYAAPAQIAAAFQKYPGGIMKLDAQSPGYDYRFDIGEKATSYGHPSGFMTFEKVEIQLLENMPKGTVLTNIVFTDQLGNTAKVKNIDLMRLTPKYDTRGEMLYSEVLLEEFNRFGFSYRKEHQEFDLNIKSASNLEENRETEATRMSITNNCLEATKWEMNLTSEDFQDFATRLKGDINLNQNKILAHCWFYLDKDLYEALQAYKNPGIEQNYQLSYDSLNTLAEASVVDFESLRHPLSSKMETEVVEVGHQSNRKLEPVDIEEFYKWQFGLFMNRKEDLTYRSILEEPVQIARFSNAGFYNPETPNIYDYGFLKHLDQVEVNNINAAESDCYVEIKLTGEYAPYEVVIGNIDLAYPDEQKLTGLLFGYNTYPKSRRYHTAQSTLFYDADDYPEMLKPYVLLVDKTTGKWVNNQKKGVEKVYISYESPEQNILQIYLLSYERVTPVWMASVKLPDAVREAIRVRKQLYAY